MNCRERLISALNHKEPDRIPLDLGGTIVTSITRNAYISLKKYLGLEVEDVKIFDYVQQLPYIDEKLLERIAVDVRMIATNYMISEKQEIYEEDNYYYFYDRWGSKLRMPKQRGHYFDWVEFPINEISMDTLKKYKWPELDSKEYILKLKEKAKFLYENTDYALAGTAIFGGGIFEQPSRIMGMELFLTSLMTNQKFANEIMEKIAELYIENSLCYLDELGKYIQVFVYWNDVATQTGPMISPEIYRKLIKPKDKKLIEAIKSKTEAKIFYHCCGAVKDFIPDLIDIGVDILNPVQVSAEGMDTAKLKKEFGKYITFWGGGCDTQHVLPYDTPGKIKSEVKRRIDDLAPGGGFIFSAVHNIQDGVPPENIMAMFETLEEYGRY
ncbi:MAG: uroporphyrinogen decarboxylase family protein [Candidatus Humimicrobiaceae bacterium]